MKTIKLLFYLSLILLLICSPTISESQNKPKEQGVVLELPGMDKVIVKKGIPYLNSSDSTLKMDIYYPPNFDFKRRIPTIIVVYGFTDKAQRIIAGQQLRSWMPYLTWCRIIAASGMAAVVYETVDPENDLLSLEKYLKSNQDKLMIDMDKIGAYTCSGNTPTAICSILNSSNNIFKCAAIYYGLILTQDFEYLSQIDTLSQKMGFKTPRLGDLKEWNKNIPILFVRAGLDNVPYLNQAFKNFYAKALDQNLPLTLINYSNGLHAFDIYNDNDTTRQIIKTTLDFWKFNLQVK